MINLKMQKTTSQKLPGLRAHGQLTNLKKVKIREELLEQILKNF
jgi:hypothetical protein